jgi:hypothetical protein
MAAIEQVLKQDQVRLDKQSCVKIGEFRANNQELERDIDELFQCYCVLREELAAHSQGCEHLMQVIAEMKK